LREKVRDSDQQQTADRPLLLFGHFFSPRAGPRPSNINVLLPYYNLHS
jgi:hypothetical protein